MRRVLLILTMMLLMAGSAWAQSTPKVELFGGYSFARVIERNANGFDVSATYNIDKNLGLTADISGLYETGFRGVTSAVFVFIPNNQTFTFSTQFPGDDVYTFLVGPKYSIRNSTRVTPFFHALFGAHRTTTNTVFVRFSPGGGAPNISTKEFSNLLFATKIGGGLDVNITKHLAARVLEVNYLRLNKIKTFGGEENPNNVQLSFGLVLRLGNK